jgi:hypothetical protein
LSQRITHDLEKMAREAAIYEACWYPEKIGITHARQLIGPLHSAITAMKADPERFKKHEAPNDWGLYEHFLAWLERYLEACQAHPDAKVSGRPVREVPSLR